MARITVKNDLYKIKATLRKYPKKIKFAIKNTLNDTAFATKKEVEKALPLYIDRPVPFTKRLTLVRKANTSKTRAEVYIPQRKWAYMQYQVEGGTEPPRGRAHAVPVKARLNAYGNVTKGNRPAAVIHKPKFFSGVPKGRSGPSGIWERQGRKGGRDKLKLHSVYKPSLYYKSRFPFTTLGTTFINKNIGRFADREIAKQIAHIKR